MSVNQTPEPPVAIFLTEIQSLLDDLNFTRPLAVMANYANGSFWHSELNRLRRTQANAGILDVATLRLQREGSALRPLAAFVRRMPQVRTTVGNQLRTFKTRLKDLGELKKLLRDQLP